MGAVCCHGNQSFIVLGSKLRRATVRIWYNPIQIPKPAHNIKRENLKTKSFHYLVLWQPGPGEPRTQPCVIHPQHGTPKFVKSFRIGICSPGTGTVSKQHQYTLLFVGHPIIELWYPSSPTLFPMEIADIDECTCQKSDKKQVQNLNIIWYSMYVFISVDWNCQIRKKRNDRELSHIG